jgi:hypothetical protein
MVLRYALLGAAALAVTGVAEVRAQSPFPPVGQQQSPFPPIGQPQQPQQKPPCFDQFIPLRKEVDKRFEVTKAAIDKRAGAPELCRLLTRFNEAEIAMIKYVEENGTWCSFPPDAVQNMKVTHAKSVEYRKQACAAAAAPRPQRPAEPTLSDALSPPIPNKDTTRTGRGTLDSLGGNPIGR